MSARKTETQKLRAALHKSAVKQRATILRELAKGTRVRLIADALGLSTQRIYKVKSKLIESGELKP